MNLVCFLCSCMWETVGEGAREGWLRSQMALGQGCFAVTVVRGLYLQVHGQFLSKLHCLGSFCNCSLIPVDGNHVVFETQLIYRQIVFPSMILKSSYKYENQKAGSSEQHCHFSACLRQAALAFESFHSSEKSQPLMPYSKLAHQTGSLQ